MLGSSFSGILSFSKIQELLRKGSEEIIIIIIIIII